MERIWAATRDVCRSTTSYRLESKYRDFKGDDKRLCTYGSTDDCCGTKGYEVRAGGASFSGRSAEMGSVSVMVRGALVVLWFSVAAYGHFVPQQNYEQTRRTEKIILRPSSDTVTDDSPRLRESIFESKVHQVGITVYRIFIKYIRRTNFKNLKVN